MKAVVVIDSATPALEALADRIEDNERFYRQWLDRMKGKIRRDVTAKHGQSQFWRKRVAGSVATSLSGGRASLFTSNPEAIHKQFGGPIVARRVKMLTIPIAPEAQGKTAGQLSGGNRQLFKVEVSGNRALLGYRDADDTFRALFLLVPRVNQRAEPWWPTEDDAVDIAMGTLNNLIQTE